ncbi:hypothetical protein WA158_001623 [Blastocystis sp. Blastoise]
MFSLISGACKWFMQKQDVCLLIVGLDNSGKTTFLEQTKGIFTKNSTRQLSRIPPTIGLNVATMDVDGFHVIFWDVGGHKSMRSLWNKYYKDAHGIIFLIDSSDEERIKESREELRKVFICEDLRELPILICANKQDIVDAVEPEIIYKSLQPIIESNMMKHEVNFAATSALTCEGLKQSILWLIHSASKTQRSKNYKSR